MYIPAHQISLYTLASSAKHFATTCLAMLQSYQEPGTAVSRKCFDKGSFRKIGARQSREVLQRGRQIEQQSRLHSQPSPRTLLAPRSGTNAGMRNCGGRR